MTHIRTLLRSYPDKYSDQVWQFSVNRKVFMLSQHKKSVDGQGNGGFADLKDLYVLSAPLSQNATNHMIKLKMRKGVGSQP